MNKIIINIFTLVLVSQHVDAISDNIKKKFPFSVLTNDYGILKEKDLDTSQEGVNPPTHFPKESNFSGFIYWQCFPRDHISISLKDLGYSSAEIEENDSELKIRAYSAPGVFHEYSMRRQWPVDGNEQRFNLWLKLMRKEKYVCLAGSYINNEEIIKKEEKQRIYYWQFDRIKTKKGGDSYFVANYSNES